ncbi:MAG: glycosyltransferase 87 family protein [Leptospiraceae bacterium]
MKNLKISFFIFALLFLLFSTFRQGLDMERHVDLSPTYVAANLLWSGQGETIYKNSAYGQTRSKAWVEFESQQMDGMATDTSFLYLPAYLLLISPLLLLGSFQAFKIVFLLLKIIGLSILLAQLADKWSRSYITGLLIIGLLSMTDAIFDSLQYGQNIEFLALLIPVYFYRVRKDHRGYSIGFFILAVLIKPWAAFLLAVPLIDRNLKLFLLLIVSLLLLLGIQILWLPGPMLDFWNQTVAHGEISILAYNNASLSALIHKISFAPNWMNHFHWEPAPENPSLISMIIRLFIGTLLFIYATSSRIGLHQRLAIMIIPPVLMGIFWNHYLLLYFPFLLYLNRRMGLRARTAIFWFLLLLALWPDVHSVKVFINSFLLRGIQLQTLGYILPFLHFMGPLILLATVLTFAVTDWRSRLLRSPRQILVLRSGRRPQIIGRTDNANS